MKRQVDALKSGEFDVIVVGGGIYGAWTALDAARRGLSVALIEMVDWASATSSASTKLIHGGLRYLEQLRLDLVHTSLEERRTLVNIAPHMVIPLRFIMPVYRKNRVGPLKLKTGLFLYDLLAGSEQPVEGHEHLEREAMTETYPFLLDDELRGGFQYGDCQTDDARMVVDIVQAGAEAGVVAANYLRADALIEDIGDIVGVHATDVETGEAFVINSEMVVNCAGPWVSILDRDRRREQLVRYSKGVHLVMPELPACDALLLMTKEGDRIFFLVPWYGLTLVGTTDADYDGDPSEVTVDDADVEYLLAETRRYLPENQWTVDDVIGKFAGLRTLKNEPGKPPSQVTREWMMTEPRTGLITSIGGKYTSARVDAGRMVDRIMKRLKRPWDEPSPTEEIPLPSAPEGDYREWREQAIAENRKSGMDERTAIWSLFRFGRHVENLRELIADDPALAGPLVAGLPFCRAEVVLSAREEMTVHLDDILRRRIPVTILSRPDQAVARDAAELAAPELDWDEKRVEEEVQRVMEKW